MGSILPKKGRIVITKLFSKKKSYHQLKNVGKKMLQCSSLVV